jgi:flagellar protein FlaG
MPADFQISFTGQRNAEIPVTRPAAAQPQPGTPAASVLPRAAEPATLPELHSAIKEAVDKLTQDGSELSFQLDHELGRVIVKLVDRNTREVLRQVPGEEVLAMARALHEGPAVGTLVHATA